MNNQSNSFPVFSYRDLQKILKNLQRVTEVKGKINGTRGQLINKYREICFASYTQRNNFGMERATLVANEIEENYTFGDFDSCLFVEQYSRFEWTQYLGVMYCPYETVNLFKKPFTLFSKYFKQLNFCLLGTNSIDVVTMITEDQFYSVHENTTDSKLSHCRYEIIIPTSELFNLILPNGLPVAYPIHYKAEVLDTVTNPQVERQATIIGFMTSNSKMEIKRQWNSVK